MEFISNAVSNSIVTEDLAYEAVRSALVAAADSSGRMCPVLIAGGLQDDETFSVKCGVSRENQLVGFKIGAYWPRNDELNVSRHSTTIVLIDPATGRLASVVQGDRLNGFRTAASDAVATALLAREDASTLSILGSGHQAEFEARALCRVRKIRRIFIAGRNSPSADSLRSLLDGLAESVILADTETACREADILVTVTPSREALFDPGWIRPGTHISAMGADQKGKRELPVDLISTSRLFADCVQQSMDIGELQYFRVAIMSGTMFAADIGDVLMGRSPGRQSSEDVTIYDSSGLALQDLHIASAIARVARAEKRAIQLQDAVLANAADFQ